jgi:hypothetical protein
MLRFLLLPFALMAISASAADRNDDNSHWKTFSNQAGWSIKHPPSWQLSSCVMCSNITDPWVFVAFSDPLTDNFVVTIHHMADKPAQETTEQWLDEVSHTGNWNPVLSREWVVVGGLRALKVNNRNTSTSTEMESIYIARDRDTFSIEAWDTRNTSFYALYQKMLSTFKFKDH